MKNIDRKKHVNEELQQNFNYLLQLHTSFNSHLYNANYMLHTIVSANLHPCSAKICLKFKLNCQDFNINTLHIIKIKIWTSVHAVQFIIYHLWWQSFWFWKIELLHFWIEGSCKFFEIVVVVIYLDICPCFVICFNPFCSVSYQIYIGEVDCSCS